MTDHCEVCGVDLGSYVDPSVCDDCLETEDTIAHHRHGAEESAKLAADLRAHPEKYRAMWAPDAPYDTEALARDAEKDIEHHRAEIRRLTAALDERAERVRAA